MPSGGGGWGVLLERKLDEDHTTTENHLNYFYRPPHTRSQSAKIVLSVNFVCGSTSTTIIITTVFGLCGVIGTGKPVRIKMASAQATVF